MRFFLILSALFLLALVPIPVSHYNKFDPPQEWVNGQTLPGNSPSQFGISTDIDGDRMVIGADLDFFLGLQGGLVFYYEWDGNNWILEQEIGSPTVLAGGNFGVSVDLDGDTLLIGAPDETGGGRAHVFTWTGTAWIGEQVLPSQGGSSAGREVALSGDVAFVSQDFAGADNISVWTRVGTLWTFQENIVPGGSNAGTTMKSSGGSIAVYSDEVEVFSIAGAIYIYNITGLTYPLGQRIGNPTPTTSGSFGRWLAIRGDTLVSGVIFVSDAWHVYNRTAGPGTWSLTQSQVHHNPVVKAAGSPNPGHDGFGISVDEETIYWKQGFDLTTTGFVSNTATYIYDLDAGVWGLVAHPVLGNSRDNSLSVHSTGGFLVGNATTTGMFNIERTQ